MFHLSPTARDICVNSLKFSALVFEPDTARGSERLSPSVYREIHATLQALAMLVATGETPSTEPATPNLLRADRPQLRLVK